MNKKAFIPISALMGALLLALFAAMTPFVAEPDRAYAQSTTIDYAENGTGPVATLSATDPDEGDMVMWTVTSGGTEDFKISDDGVLMFLSPPNYEAPAGGASDDSNTYVVTVSASDGKAADGTTDTTFTADATFVVTVKVTDVPEAEKLTWAITGQTVLLMQFEVGAVLTATVSGGDISTAKPLDVTGRQWYRSAMAIPNATSAAYTVTDEDVGHRIRVRVDYRVGDGRQEPSLSLTSDYPVLATRTGNTAPTFAAGDVTRMVNEGAKGMMVGAPVTATDDGDGVLTYSLGGGDANRFEIDQKTGQITTLVDLDYEASGGGDNQCSTANACAVEVTATDSAGEASTAKAVTITIVNLDDEKPTFTNSATLLSTIMLAENTTTLSDTATEITYTATDLDGDRVNLGLMGSDAARFELSGTDVLSFRAAPDYENPMDANGDNMYEVTVRASDGTMYAERMVKVTITNANEALMMIMATVGTDASLTSLRLTDNNDMDVELMPMFASDTTEYTAMVGSDVEYVMVEAMANQGREIDGDGMHTLMDGDTTITVTVSVGDTDMAYTVVVTREALSDEARLLREYDDDGDGSIGAGELRTAILDYLNEDLSPADLRTVILLYLG